MYIVVIFCLNTGQNCHKFSFLALQHSEVWEISILAPPNISIGCYRSVYLGNLQKCLKFAKSIGKYFGHYKNFIYFPHWVQQHTLSGCILGNFHYFPLNFGSLAVKTMAFFEISSLFITKPSVDHTSYKYCVLCMVKHKYFQYSPHILAHWS